jgi:hypothetical protein
MDRMTADYLASTAPNPTQAALDAVLGRMTRARLVRSRLDENRRFQFDVVRLDVSDAAGLHELCACLRIDAGASAGHMMMIEDHRLEIWAGDECLAALGWLAGSRLRWWGVWKNDAQLAEPEQLRHWVAERLLPDK